MVVRRRWMPGPEDGEVEGPVLVSATRFVYRRLRDMPAVNINGVRLRRSWRRRPGAVGLLVAGDFLRRTTWSISVWRSEEDLRCFLAAPDHVPLMRRFRPRLEESAAVRWIADELDIRALWAEAERRLPPAGATPAPASTA